MVRLLDVEFEKDMVLELVWLLDLMMLLEFMVVDLLNDLEASEGARFTSSRTFIMGVVLMSGIKKSVLFRSRVSVLCVEVVVECVEMLVLMKSDVSVFGTLS